MRKKSGFIVVVTVLFIALNCILIGTDKEAKISRVAYIKDWTTVQQKDMHETYQAAGVISYADESNVYFDESIGHFKEFQVKEGQTVQAGDSLYSYYVKDFEETQYMLEQKANELEQEVEAIDAAIEKVQAYQATSQNNTGDQPSQGTKITLTDDSDDMDAALDKEYDLLRKQMEDTDSNQAEALLEQYMIEKEKEHEQKQIQLEGIEAQITALSASGDTITVESPYDGKVTMLSNELTDPLITIQDPERLLVAGEINEKERMQTEEGMEVRITIRENNEVLQGELHQVSTQPTDKNVDGFSMYPFTVDLIEDEEAEEERTEASDELLPGYHADLEIITKVSPATTAVQDQAIYRNHIWRMNNKGKLVRQKAEAGLSEGGYTEVENSLEPGDCVVVEPKSNYRNGTVFITPLNMTELNWRALRADKKSNWKYLIIGLLSR